MRDEEQDKRAYDLDSYVADEDDLTPLSKIQRTATLDFSLEDLKK